MAETIVQFFRELIKNDYITTLIVSMIPFVEVRGAIPIAIAMKMNPWMAFLLSFIGSAIVAPILIAILRPIMNWLKKIKLITSIIESIEEGFSSRAKKVEDNANKSGNVELKKMIGLLGFIAVPVPMTGVWTGSAIGVFLGLSYSKTVAIVILGDFIASVLMTLLSYFCAKYIDIILIAVFIIVVIAVALFIGKIIYKVVQKGKQSNVSEGNNN